VIEELKKKFKGQKVAIIGGGFTTYNQATGKPFDYSDAYENIWTVNGGWIHHKSSNLGFLMDDWASPAHDTDISCRARKAEVLSEADIPILTTTEYEEFPCLVRYPLEEVVTCVNRTYFGETLTYMVAFAILCEVRAIAFQGTDYINCKPAERACTEHMVAIAMERGIEITSNPESHFLNIQLDKRNNHVPGFYGYLRETFPFRLTPEGDLWRISADSKRPAEIEAFKKSWRESNGC